MAGEDDQLRNALAQLLTQGDGYPDFRRSENITDARDDPPLPGAGRHGLGIKLGIDADQKRKDALNRWQVGYDLQNIKSSPLAAELGIYDTFAAPVSRTSLNTYGLPDIPEKKKKVGR